jgi:hypothetical protein
MISLKGRFKHSPGQYEDIHIMLPLQKMYNYPLNEWIVDPGFVNSHNPWYVVLPLFGDAIPFKLMVKHKFCSQLTTLNNNG